ncbi:MAG: tetratricopeptide repeat protein [Pseudohongiellaceae bacterium]
MSLLMDALRKAEEAKKKAAQEAKSEEAVPTPVAEEQPAKVTAEKTSADSPADRTELNMVELEEVSARSSVPDLQTPIEFEDEEDYVLPSSIGRPGESNATLDQTAVSEDSAIDEPAVEQTQAAVEPTGSVQENPQKEDAPLIAESTRSNKAPGMAEPLGLDDLEADGAPQLESVKQELLRSAELESRKLESAAAARSFPGTETSAKPMSAARPKAQDESSRRVAQNVFAAKKSVAVSKRNIQVAVGVGLALVAAIGTYLFISVNQESTFNIPDGNYVSSNFVDGGTDFEDDDAQSSSPDEEPIDTADFNLATTSVDLDQVNAGSALEAILAESEFPDLAPTAEPEPSGANLQPEILPDQSPRPETIATETIATTIGDLPVVTPSTAENVESEQTGVADPMPTAAATEPIKLISFRKQVSVPVVDPNVEQAYTAYQRGSLDAAEVLYRRALGSDPLQRDALLGLATILRRNGEMSEALDLYSRLLARNPTDPLARAGLMEILPAGSPASQEADLKRLLSDYPNVAALVYAHGNFLASNQRWSEAQQAYFRALQLAKSDALYSGLVNPDYAFNLAVSLEHLNQAAAAQSYYREAIDFAVNHPAGFDLAALRRRLANRDGSGRDE